MNKLMKALLPVTTFVRIDVKRLFRDKVAIFFVFFFPLIFLLIFGTIFGGTDNISFRLALINNSETEFAGQFEGQIRENDIFEVDELSTTLEEARERMRRSQIQTVVILPEEFGETGRSGLPSGEVQILYDQNNETSAQTLESVLTTALKEVNETIAPTVTPFTVSTESTADDSLTRFDFIFAGLMGFTLLSLGILGPTTVFPRLKQRGVLRRYETTTLKVWQVFVSNVMSNAFVGILALILMFVVSVLFFDLNMRGNYFNLVAVVVMGVILLYGIGLAIGGWAKNENQAAPLSQIVVLPMMFLSGVFFPTFLMPEALQSITQYIPLTPIIDSIRLVVTENAGFSDLGPQLTIMGIWAVVIYVVAFKVFRWE